MRKIECNDYTIYINDWEGLATILRESDYSKVIVVVDENTKEHCLPLFTENVIGQIHLIEIPSGEQYKTIATSTHIWTRMIEIGADRHSVCINLGGGVIGDMGGWTAATFMRGMDFIQVPTTLLSQVDASVGGKLGIDFEGYKNLVGIITPPRAVCIFTDFLETLPYDQLRSGYAELLKHGLIADKNTFKFLSDVEDITSLDWEPIVHDSVQIKKEVTDQDPKERGLRKILNYGHTLGHAIESALLTTPDELLHGEAIAIGMIMEAHLSYQLGYISLTECDGIKSAFINLYGHHPSIIPTVTSLIQLMKTDKKNKGGQIRFSLLESVGVGNYNQVVTDDQIRQAIEYYQKR